jgi:hypothetical protein
MSGASSIKAGEAYVIISAKLDQLRADLKAGQGEIQKFGGSFKGLGAAISSPMAIATAAVTAAVTATVASIREFINTGSEINDLSNRTGIASGELQHMAFAAKQSGASMAELEMAARQFVKGGGNIAQFEAIGQSIAAIADPSERARAAIDAFGKSGTKLLPMFSEFKTLKASSQALGPILTPQEVRLADQLGDSFGGLYEAVKRTMQQFAQFFTTRLQGELERIVGLITAVSTTLKGLREAASFGKGGDILDVLGNSAIYKPGEWQKMGRQALAGSGKAQGGMSLEAEAAAAADSMRGSATSAEDMVRSIQRASDKRAALIQSFETPAERFIRRQQEILAAIKQVHNNHALNFIGEGEFQSQRSGLNTALARLRQQESERIAGLMPKAAPEVARMVEKVQSSASGTFSGAGAGLLGHAADPILRENKEQTTLMRKIEKNTREGKTGGTFS